MPFGALIIGDEIMRGKRQDKHMAQLIAILRSRGLTLAWCQYLGDDPELITATLRRTLAGPDIVFSFGGIGATPDDHTRACAAAAAGVDLLLHPEAEAEIRGRFGADTTPNRLKMGEFPRGASNDTERLQPHPRLSRWASITSCRAFPSWPGPWSSGCSTIATPTCFTGGPKPRHRSWCTTRPKARSRR